MTETTAPVKTAQQRRLSAFWEAVGVAVLVAAGILAWADWTFLWIALVAGVAAFPTFLASDTLIAKYTAANREATDRSESQ